MAKAKVPDKSAPIIIVGADPGSKHLDHPGGQVTAVLGLIGYLARSDIAYHILDTSQSSFPAPTARSRIQRGINRTADLLKHLLSNRPRGVLIFTGEGFSMVERGIQALLCRIFRVPAIMCLRSGYIITDAQRSKTLRYLYRIILSLPAQIVVQGSNWIVQLKELGFDVSNYKVVPNWPAQDRGIAYRARDVPAAKPVRFVFVGWLTERKGINELLSAYDLIADEGLAKLTFAGGGDLLEKVMKWSAKHGHAVDVKGWVDPDAMSEIYDQHDVLVLPSYAEGFPNVLIESMARAMPAIATPVGGIPDSLEDGMNGWLVPVRDAQKLAAAMRKYIEDRSVLKEHSQNAFQTVKQKHNMNKNCEQLISLLGSPSE